MGNSNSVETQKTLVDKRLDELGAERVKLINRLREVEEYMADLFELRNALGG